MWPIKIFAATFGKILNQRNPVVKVLAWHSISSIDWGTLNKRSATKIAGRIISIYYWEMSLLLFKGLIELKLLFSPTHSPSEPSVG